MILEVKILKLAIHKKCINIQHFSKENNTIYQLTLTLLLNSSSMLILHQEITYFL